MNLGGSNWISSWKFSLTKIMFCQNIDGYFSVFVSLMFSVRQTHPLAKIVNGALIDLPSPSSLSYAWNFGSLLGVCLVIQLATGLFLALHYSCDLRLAFERVNHISRDVNYGWLLRLRHANGASFFFICLYLHVGRGLYFGRYNYATTWSVGVIILLLIQGTAFLGYVLPWGQMSFWGATVITNLVSSVPVIGDDIVKWLWGGFSVDNATLTRFFAFHFLLPFIVTGLVGVHFIFLHETGSNNPLGVKANVDKVPFQPYFAEKDILGLILFFLVFFFIVMEFPYLFGDPENFIPANSLVTPVHIQPEWYFLFAYAILRAIPNKLGGVIALGLAILILLLCPVLPKPKFRSLRFYPVGKLYFWRLIGTFFLLTFVGAKPVEEPYVLLGQILRAYYFMYFITRRYLNKLSDFFLRRLPT